MTGFEAIQTALARRYDVERVLGHGGMATVYLAEDLKHHRKVAVKVLRPDLAATLGPDRFLREIEIAAQLHHPHILPLYDSGEADGILYYVMPFEEGQSLRDRLTKQGELPMAEAVHVLRNVADALAHAHQHGVVHRDIKPENILLSGEHALVTDFGVAKAVSEATGRHQLTTAGVALGTPAYMAPEQASGDPSIDRRADIYAVGVVAYELLTGRQPFTGTNAQQILARHLTEQPDPVSDHRQSVPPALETVVMRCLEKDPANRWQSAEELRAQLDSLTTPTSGVIPTDLAAVAEKSRWWKPAAALGLVLLLLGAFGLSRFVSVGRAGTLIGQAVLAEHDQLLVAEFENRTGDLSLGPTITDAIRVELQQSPVVEVMSQRAMWDGMRRMGLDLGAPLPNAQVRELAERESAKAYVTGDVSRLGSGYQITARVVATADGSEALTVRVTAPNDTELIGAVEELGKQLRRNIGESLRSVRSTPKLARVTTASLPALRSYMAALRAEIDGDRPKAIRLLEEAVTLDTAFAMAWRALAAVHGNDHRYAEADAAIARAFASSDRLPDLERLRVRAMYHKTRQDYDLAEEALRQAIELEHGVSTSAIGLSDLLLEVHRWREAEEAALDGLEADSLAPVGYWNAVEAQVAQNRFAAADSTLHLMAQRMPTNSWLPEMQTLRWIAERSFEPLEAFWDSVDASGGTDIDEVVMIRCWEHLYRGRLREWERCDRLDALSAQTALRIAGDSVGVRRLMASAREAIRAPASRQDLPWLIAAAAELGPVSEARQLFDEWRRQVGPDDRGFRVDHHFVAGTIALAEGKPDSAAAAFLEWNRSGYVSALHIFNRGFAEAADAMDRAGRPDSAIALYERALAQPSIYAAGYEVRWYPFALRRLGELYEARGDRSKAIEYYERFIDLWRDADATLQPQVRAARERLARLVMNRG